MPGRQSTSFPFTRSSRTAPRLRRRYRRLAGQRLGPERGPDDAVVGGQQRHQHLDALQRRRLEGGAHRRGRRWPDGHRVQRQAHRLRRQPERQERRRPLPVRDRGRDDPRLDAGCQRHDGGRRCRPLGGRRGLQGPRRRERPAVRDRLPQRPRRRLRRVVQADHHPRRLQGRQGRRRASRRSGSRRSAGTSS